MRFRHLGQSSGLIPWRRASLSRKGSGLWAAGVSTDLMTAESLEMSHFRHGRGQKMCDLMLSWDGSELMRYPLSRGRLEDSCSFILRRKLKPGLEAVPSAGAGLGLGQGLTPLSFLLLSASAQSSQGFLWLPRPLCAPQWWLVILGNLSLIPVPSSQTCLSFGDP